MNPKADHIASVRAVGSILDIADDVDLAVVVVPAAAVAGVVEECGAQAGVRRGHPVVGVRRDGAGGGALEPRCSSRPLGASGWWGRTPGHRQHRPRRALHATFVALGAARGRVSAVGVGHRRRGDHRTGPRRGLGISSFVALGNRPTSPGTTCSSTGPPTSTPTWSAPHRVVRQRPPLRRLARQLTRAKPAVGGEGRVAPGRPPAPTAAATCPPMPCCARPASSASDTLARPARHRPPARHAAACPRGRRVAVVGNAGGSLALAADAAVGAGLELAVLSRPPSAALSALVGHEVRRRQPRRPRACGPWPRLRTGGHDPGHGPGGRHGAGRLRPVPGGTAGDAPTGIALVGRRIPTS